MALTFSSASGANVNCGSAAVLDDLQSGANGFTVCALVKRNANGYDKNIASKFSSVTAGWALFCEGVPPGYTTFGGLRFAVYRGSGIGDQTTYETDNRITSGDWMFAAASFKDGDATKMDLYYGSMSAIAIEETSYTLSANGTGTLNTDATASYIIGDGADNFEGDIARVGVYNTKLTLAQIQALQFAPTAFWNNANCVALHDLYGTGTQPDLSGELNNGTVTSATVASHVPRGAPYAVIGGWQGAFTAAAAGVSFPRLERFRPRGITRGLSA